MNAESSEARYWRRLRESRARLTVLSVVFFVFLAALSVRLLRLPFWEPTLSARAQQSGASSRFHARADIVDRNGVLLASDLEVSSLNADVPLMRRAGVDLAEAARRLSQVLPQLDEPSLHARLERGGRSRLLARLLPSEAYAVRRLGIAGIHLIARPTRLYPHGDLFAHAVGFVNIDNIGQSGIELSQNSRLQRDARPLALTLDELLQHILRKHLESAYVTHEARAACGVILDAGSAEILALVSLPVFDPHRPSKITPSQYFNCVVQGNYELGSIFKILTVAMALESRVASLDSLYDVREPIVFANKKISDIKQSARPLTLEEVFIHSSNIGAALIARDLGALLQERYLSDFGMLDVLPVAFEGKSRPLLSSGSEELRAMTIGFGHGIAVSPLHLASAVAGLVSDGIVRSPVIVKDARREQSQAHVLSEETVGTLRRLLFENIEHGTGARASVAGYALGGKTGTAEKPVRTAEGIVYGHEKVVASFVGVVPVDAPRYVVFTMLDEPQSDSEDLGAINASRVMTRAIAAIFRDMIVARGIRRNNPTKSPTKNLTKNPTENPTKNPTKNLMEAALRKEASRRSPQRIAESAP